MSVNVLTVDVALVECELVPQWAPGYPEWAPDTTGGRLPSVRVKVRIESADSYFHPNESEFVIRDPDEARGVLARWVAYCEGEAPRPKFSLDIARMLIAS